jgi:dipeptidyl aminopeptidase/acylaminoacyl peptidase
VTQFSDLRDYLAIPAVTSLSLSPDGTWLAATVQALGPDPKKKISSIWRIGTGQSAPVRLTRSADGESDPRFLPDGSLLFVSRRSDPAVGTGDGEETGETPALWLLPAGGGEAARIAAPPGGVATVAVAPDSGSFLLAAPAFPGTADAADDAERRKSRREAGVSAILHESGPVRYWDHDLGPDCLRLLAGQPLGVAGLAGLAADRPELVDLTPDPGRALDEQSFDLSPDGSVAVSGWRVPATAGPRVDVVVIEVAAGTHRTLLTAADADFGQPLVSPDGALVVASRSEHDTYQRPGDATLVVTALDGRDPGAGRDLLTGFDRQPAEAAWAPDSGSVFFTADDNGRRPVFRVEVETGEITRVTGDDGSYDHLCPAPDGQSLFALRSAISEPAAPVRIDLTDSAAEPVRLSSPAGAIEVPGRVEDVSAAAADGAAIRGWLVLPVGASEQSPAPLVLWVHGGPVMSWNAWSWRWNPWLMAARGYAVLLPDPALSTGYGQAFIARGHGNWGGAPFTDVMTITDAVAARPEIDASRIAMMGGSFGGYMANWIAGHTDRFAAIVSHAGLWTLDQMFGTTDSQAFWRRIFGDPTAEPGRYLDNSPHLHADGITTPILIVHGDKDYRVPVGEALRMYWDLTSRGKTVRFLYFPDENHWILKPGDVRVWYETVFAFLAEHVLGQQWQRPDLL